MASPQVEDGYTRIADELLEALCRVRISGQARQIFDFILRKTYGFGKTEDCISNSQFVAGTGLKKNKVCDSITYLLNMKLIIVTDKGNTPAKSYAINKNYAEWAPLPKKGTYPIMGMAVPNNGNDCTQYGGPQYTIDNLTIDKKIKRSLPEPVPNNGNNPDPQHPKPQDKPKPPTKQAPVYPQEIVEFVTNYQNHVKQTLNRQAPEVTPALIKNGCAIVDQIIRLDKFSLNEIREAMRWAVKDEFWTANARSLAALRKKGNNGLTKFQNIFEAYERRDLTVEELVERHEAKRRAANG